MTTKVTGPRAETLTRYVVTYPAAVEPERRAEWGSDEKRTFNDLATAIAFAQGLYDAPAGPQAGGYGKHTITVTREVLTTLWQGGIQYVEPKR